MNIKGAVSVLAKVGRKAAPTACAVGGAVGVIATGYSAAKAGKEVGAWEAVNREPMPIKRKFRTYAKSTAIGAASIALIFMCDRLHAKLYTALGAAASIIQERNHIKDAALQTMQGDIYKEDREEATKRADEAMAEDIWNRYRKNGIEPVDTHTGSELWYEPISKTWFLANEAFVGCAEYYINRNLMLRGEVPFSEYLRFLGLEQVAEKPGFQLIHWDILEGEEIYGYKWIDFVHQDRTLNDGTHYTGIFYPFEPHLSEK